MSHASRKLERRHVHLLAIVRGRLSAAADQPSSTDLAAHRRRRRTGWAWEEGKMAKSGREHKSSGGVALEPRRFSFLRTAQHTAPLPNSPTNTSPMAPITTSDAASATLIIVMVSIISF